MKNYIRKKNKRFNKNKKYIRYKNMKWTNHILTVIIAAVISTLCNFGLQYYKSNEEKKTSRKERIWNLKMPIYMTLAEQFEKFFITEGKETETKIESFNELYNKLFIVGNDKLIKQLNQTNKSDTREYIKKAIILMRKELDPTTKLSSKDYIRKKFKNNDNNLNKNLQNTVKIANEPENFSFDRPLALKKEKQKDEMICFKKKEKFISKGSIVNIRNVLFDDRIYPTAKNASVWHIEYGINNEGEKKVKLKKTVMHFLIFDIPKKHQFNINEIKQTTEKKLKYREKIKIKIMNYMERYPKLLASQLVDKIKDENIDIANNNLIPILQTTENVKEEYELNVELDKGYMTFARRGGLIGTPVINNITEGKSLVFSYISVLFESVDKTEKYETNYIGCIDLRKQAILFIGQRRKQTKDEKGKK